VAGVRIQEWHADSVDLRHALEVCRAGAVHLSWADLKHALWNVCRTGAVDLSWPDRIDWGNVVHAKRAWMERGVVAVVQLIFSLRTGTGSTAQRLRVGLDLEATAALSRKAA
jgi:hypothetical protein